MTTLRDRTAALETMVNQTLGDEITYTVSGDDPATFDAWVEFGNQDVATGQSRVQATQIVIEIPKTLTTPAQTDRIAVTIMPGVTWAPASWDTDDTGANWRIICKRANA